MADNSREIIYLGLTEILEKGALSHIVEKDILDKYDYLDMKEKAFIKRMLDGTTEKLLVLDKVIDDYSKIKTKKLKPPIRTILRMGVYQILFMDRVPDSAACNEACKIATRHGFNTLKGYVNGVLRSVSRDKDKILEGLNEDNLTVPQWIREHLISSYGEEKTLKILEDIDKAHPVSIRVRSPKMDVKDLIRVPNVENAYYLKEGTSVKDVPGYLEGYFVVQDIASQLVLKNSMIQKGDTVLDVCASPGGKAIEAYDMGGIVTAFDISDKKIKRIEDNIIRCHADGSDGIKISVKDASEYDDTLKESADIVIADVPCSGLGVMGRKADIRHKTKKEDLDNLPKIQKDIAGNVWKYVKKGGVLMYSTCTMNPKENEELTDFLTENYPLTKEYEKQFLPGIDGTDGFYIARLRRKSD